MTNEEKYNTPEERYNAFSNYCRNHKCGCCPMMNMGTSHECAFYWLALEAEEEKPMPCPFCGAKCEVIGAINHRAKCTECNYESIMDSDKEKVIAAHNRVCRAVRAFKESEVKE